MEPKLPSRADLRPYAYVWIAQHATADLIYDTDHLKAYLAETFKVDREITMVTGYPKFDNIVDWINAEMTGAGMHRHVPGNPKLRRLTTRGVNVVRAAVDAFRREEVIMHRPK